MTLDILLGVVRALRRYEHVCHNLLFFFFRNVFSVLWCASFTLLLSSTSSLRSSFPTYHG
ncbi:hypothetical protein M407DRAFT_187865 [Tulasnella calospora MUT 4182]|uniref:Uncharacterized protein n=1 Tax=Tulasnella calospora MUT 4182 TaxID=1051891 RepID=A0A0C3QKH1_9AGAM|nr:hypothetical protein M407DRAFT_187865 [Tulasnella calospora MUT 4182]